ncbi:hypothetical protein [Dactylosporangium matsuzakiense]|uniref:Uncharacterized protein n=1 Tax=Dactylosporangium matsuzakiense TaxID=53360 RepID=A0A9W6KRT4_9ACTN|nr:hypothetical protein [Dactylosporangium matsuzakiense]UWZ45484.1 hypothetical protein Dmats_02805 [Dactylosporangium matsuzakiense]GLL04359.1 hypothetical protein GCM10017581_061060 [Dactylosporangium matsuzakiense]
MRTALRLLGTRYGIALILLVIVLVIVTLGRTVLDNGRGSSATDAIGPTVATVPRSADPFSSLGDDGVDESVAAAPSLSKGAADAATVATRFANAWVRKPGVTGDQWRAGLKPDASTELMASLAETDPADVPTATITGATQLQANGGTTVARIPAEGGTIVLGLQVAGGRWQVTSLDWEVA